MNTGSGSVWRPQGYLVNLLGLILLSVSTYGLDGDRVIPKKFQIANASHSSRQSCRMIHNSITTPITTTTENTQTQGSQRADEISRALISLSRADMALSNAEMELSRAESLEGRLEAVWVRGAKVAIIGLSGAMFYGLWLIILALREERSYKKTGCGGNREPRT